jgi:hypothetical protein
MRALFFGLAMVLTACGGGVVTRVGAPPPLPPDLACVAVQTPLSDVTLDVDGASLGALSTWRDGRVCVRPGPRIFRFSAPGHYALTLEFTLDAQETTPLVLDLVPRP